LIINARKFLQFPGIKNKPGKSASILVETLGMISLLVIEKVEQHVPLWI
jgi:hypothetical protein